MISTFVNYNVIHNESQAETSLLRKVFTSPFLRDIFCRLRFIHNGFQNSKKLFAPSQWQCGNSPNIRSTNYHTILSSDLIHKGIDCVISNAAYVTDFNISRLNKLISQNGADIFSVTVDPDLVGYREKILVTSRGGIAGVRRMYGNYIESDRIPCCWPHHFVIRNSKLNRIIREGGLCASFGDFVELSLRLGLIWKSFRIGGWVLNLEEQSDLIEFFSNAASSMPQNRSDKKQTQIHSGARLVGKNILADSVKIDKGAVVLGPSILADNVTLSADCAINASIIGPGVYIESGTVLENRIVFETPLDSSEPHRPKPTPSRIINKSFRTWPLLSYPRLIKGVIDFLISAAAIILFAPVFLIVAIAVKLNSKGTVLFGHKRQGKGGKEFRCWKFRTMIIGANDIQNKLRTKNEVDGPQFKMENDPRITAVGKFLRETYLDEIPQFINILLGQMSLVGPRPSPKSENSLCPVWRDARLSVRPGITGLWQVKRTRLAGRDFQEWIYYDIKYVQNMGLWLDITICLRTAAKLIANFLRKI
ncbi:MAG: sugar transferase [Phycisphaerae bacterium]|nr:sugar transferase [Phycisphaerae bacterium]